jgi:hypothetical protein
MVGDFLFASALLLLTPTVSTALVVPINVLMCAAIDFGTGHPEWLDHPTGIALMVSGVAVILSGFVGINTNDPSALKSTTGVQNQKCPAEPPPPVPVASKLSSTGVGACEMAPCGEWGLDCADQNDSEAGDGAAVDRSTRIASVVDALQR